ACSSPMRARTDTLLDSVPAPPTESEPPPLPATVLVEPPVALDDANAPLAPSEPAPATALGEPAVALDEPAVALDDANAPLAPSEPPLSLELSAPNEAPPALELDTQNEAPVSLGLEAPNEAPLESAPPVPSDPELDRAPTLAPPAASAAPFAPSLEAEPERAPPSALEAEPEPAPPSAPVEPAAASVLGFSLRSIAGLEELPENLEADLVRTVELHMLDEYEEATGFGLAIVLEGTVAVMPAVTDVVCGRAAERELVVAEGHLTDNMALKVVAENGPARVATWTSEDVSRMLATCPASLAEALCTRGDRLQAVAGASMGPLGEQLDEMLRNLVLDRCVTRVLDAGEVVAEAGKPLSGLALVGAGRLELVTPAAPDTPEGELAPGDFLFPGELMRAAPAPLTARAGRSGALILFCDRRTAHELLVSVPPLLEILS
ncbi:MAG: hypothetical protein DIU78_010615, partial [Pseudomonadota bacterium]